MLPKPVRSVPQKTLLPAARPIKVLLPDGSPAAGVSVHCRGLNSFHAATADDEGVALAGFPGGYVTLDAGDHWATQSLRLKGEGPWTLRLGPCAVELDVRGTDGRPLEFYLFTIDGEGYYGRPNCRMRGLAAGGHRILVAATGYLAKDCMVNLEAGETRKPNVRLQRPPN